jgi:hypothetical protein
MKITQRQAEDRFERLLLSTNQKLGIGLSYGIYPKIRFYDRLYAFAPEVQKRASEVSLLIVHRLYAVNRFFVTIIEDKAVIRLIKILRGHRLLRRGLDRYLCIQICSQDILGPSGLFVRPQDEITF